MNRPVAIATFYADGHIVVSHHCDVYHASQAALRKARDPNVMGFAGVCAGALVVRHFGRINSGPYLRNHTRGRRKEP